LGRMECAATTGAWFAAQTKFIDKPVEEKLKQNTLCEACDPYRKPQGKESCFPAIPEHVPKESQKVPKGLQVLDGACRGEHEQLIRRD